jgi:hypothetical protein
VYLATFSGHGLPFPPCSRPRVPSQLERWRVIRIAGETHVNAKTLPSSSRFRTYLASVRGVKVRVPQTDSHSLSDRRVFKNRIREVLPKGSAHFPSRLKLVAVFRLPSGNSRCPPTLAYLGDRIGRLGVIVTRQATPETVQRKIFSAWNDSAPNRKVILTLTDEHLNELLDLRCRENSPTKWIQKHYRGFRTTVQ